MRRVLPLVLLAACGDGDRARAPAPRAPGDPRVATALTSALTEAMTRAVAAADQARVRRAELARLEQAPPADADTPALLGALAVADDDALAVLGGTAPPPTVTLRGARGHGGFPPDQVDIQAAAWREALESCLAPGALDPGVVGSASVRIVWEADGRPRVRATASVPRLADCVEQHLAPVDGVAPGASFYGFAQLR